MKFCKKCCIKTYTTSNLSNALRRDKKISEMFNTGAIKLVPKGEVKMEPKNYQLLTMPNTVYKVMAKALALKSENLSRRVDTVWFCAGQKHTRGHDWAAAQEEEMINMDFQKVYDRVRWDFILAVVDKMEFGQVDFEMVQTLFTSA